MNKQELIDAVANEAGIAKSAATETIEAFLATVTNAVGQGRCGSTDRTQVFQYRCACGPSGSQSEDRRGASNCGVDDRQVHRRQNVQGRSKPVGR
jgi:hypothetical protein